MELVSGTNIELNNNLKRPVNITFVLSIVRGKYGSFRQVETKK